MHAVRITGAGGCPWRRCREAKATVAASGGSAGPAEADFGSANGGLIFFGGMRSDHTLPNNIQIPAGSR